MGDNLKKDLGLIVGTLILLILVSGCIGNSNSYTLLNSTFNIPSDFQLNNTTSYNKPVNYTEMTFKLNDQVVLGVIQYPNEIEYANGIKNLINYPVTNNYTQKIRGIQVTVLEKQDNNENIFFAGEDNDESYFFTKSGKYYSIVANDIGNKYSINRHKIEEAMQMIVDTIK